MYKNVSPKCSMMMIGNNLIETCDTDEKCIIKNNIMECPGWTNNQSYSIYKPHYDSNEDHSNNNNNNNLDAYYALRNSKTNKINHINSGELRQKETQSDKPSQLIQEKDNILPNKPLYEHLSTNDTNTNNELPVQPIQPTQSTQSTRSIESIESQQTDTWTKYKSWIITLLVLLCIAVIILLYLSVKCLRNMDLFALQTESL